MAPFLSSRTAKAPKSPKLPGRSLFSKALPAPPVFERFFSSSSSSAALASAEPTLPPLPPPSSNLLDTASYSFVPSAQVPGGSPASSYADYSGYYSNYPTDSAYPTSPAPVRSPQPPYAAARRPVPGAMATSTSAASSATSVSSATLPLPSLPPKNGPAAAKKLPPQPSAEQLQPPAGRAIRRRPVGNATAEASPTSSRTQPAAAVSSPPLPAVILPHGLSSFNFQDVTSPGSPGSPGSPRSPGPVSVAPQLPDLPTSSAPLLQLPNLPELAGFSALSSDLQPPPPRQHSPSSSAQSTSQHQPQPQQQWPEPARAPSPPPRAASPGGASISSILSAYSQSSLPAGKSSASEGTASTSHSSYRTGSSPSLSRAGNSQLYVKGAGAAREADEALTPLSYLLEEDYGEGSDGSEVTEEELFRHYGQYDPEEDGHASPDTSNVSTTISPPPPQPQQQQQQQTLPPRSTSLHNQASSPDESILPPLPTGAPPRTLADAAASTPPFVAPVAAAASQLWARRSEKADGALSLPELDLTLASSTSAVTAGSTFASSNVAQQNQQKQLPSHPSAHSTLRNQPALPPPLSPLPPPPSRLRPDQLHAPPRSPFVAGSPAAVSAPSPRLGLPGRDIRPSRQASPAVTPVLASTEAAELVGSTANNSPNSSSTSLAVAAGPVSTMGQSISKFEAKIENKLRRKEAKNGAASANGAAVPPPLVKDVSSSPSPQLQVAPIQPSLPAAPPLQRLPTPDYDDEEDRSKHTHFNGSAGNGAATATATNGSAVPAAVAPAVYAPVSPATSPIASPASTLGLGILPASAPFLRPENREVSPTSSPQSAAPPQFRTALPGRDIRPVKSASPVVPPEQQQQQQQQQQQFAPRTSSRKVSFSTPAPRDQYRSPDDDSTVSESGSQMTIKAMPPPTYEKSLADLPLAAGMPPLFPTGYMAPVAADAVLAAPPPGPVHYLCLHRHRDMFRDRNVNYPLSCQACQTSERSVRWRCKWCYLRVCTGCRAALQGDAMGGDLERLMVQLAQTGGDAVHREASAALEESYGPPGQGMPLMTELPVIREA